MRNLISFKLKKTWPGVLGTDLQRPLPADVLSAQYKHNVNNGQGEMLLQKTVTSASRQQCSVSARFAISSHIKSIINSLISAWNEVGQKQSHPGGMNSIVFLLVFPTQ